MASNKLEFTIEAILFAAGEPMQLSRLCKILGLDRDMAEETLRELETHYNGRGVRLVRVEDSVQLCSAPEYSDIIRRAMEKRRAPQLAQAALEVLAIIAYFQPVTTAYIERVRGVDCAYTMRSLQNRGLIESCGKLQVPGRPTLYRTTGVFLRSFGLSDLQSLPPLPMVEDESEAHTQLREAIETLQREQVELEDAESDTITVSEGIAEAKETAESDAISEE